MTVGWGGDDGGVGGVGWGGGVKPSDYRTVGLSDRLTVEPSDYRTVGFTTYNPPRFSILAVGGCLSPLFSSSTRLQLWRQRPLGIAATEDSGPKPLPQIILT